MLDVANSATVCPPISRSRQTGGILEKLRSRLNVDAGGVPASRVFSRVRRNQHIDTSGAFDITARKRKSRIHDTLEVTSNLSPGKYRCSRILGGNLKREPSGAVSVITYWLLELAVELQEFFPAVLTPGRT